MSVLPPIIAVPLAETLPKPTANIKNKSHFSASWTTIVTDLREELARLGARDVRLEGAWEERTIARDGSPKADTKTTTPGVILVFEHPRHGRMVYRCSTYWHWIDNVRAIGLTLAALRAISRYGAVAKDEQYAGFKALPAQAGNLALTPALAAKAISEATGGAFPAPLIQSTYDAAVAAVRLASTRTHPDAGGQPGAFEAVQEAKRVLAQHFGRPL